MPPKHPELDLKYRQPRVFGPLPGPRNVPLDKRNLPDNQTTTMVSVAALVDEKALQELLPPRCRLFGEPVVSASISYLHNIGWLAGRGYNILALNFPIAFDGDEGTLTGLFTPVLWESMADPIMTGREELGFSKLYAEIPPVLMIGDRYRATAGWEGFRFFEIEAGDLTEAPLAAEGPSFDGRFHYRFMPKVGAQGEADAEYMAFIPAAEARNNMRVTQRLTGKGSFRFLPTRWEDMPLQYPIINALAALSVREFRGASVTFSAASGSIGASLGGARKVK